MPWGSPWLYTSSSSQALMLSFHPHFSPSHLGIKGPTLGFASCIMCHWEMVVVSTQGSVEGFGWTFYWMVHRHYAANCPEEAQTPGQRDNSWCNSSLKTGSQFVSTGLTGLSRQQSQFLVLPCSSPRDLPAFPPLPMQCSFLLSRVEL